ncbi:phosphoenolpyruvate carboxylase kinase 1-like [Pistacia vera]|uniref:phosphoenolpyruvate carboxylase kinase 1-like n=1 Tax=Pistacia vera TaxID=55513 RepID=UPI0012638AAA|nr:phosphoenolpyruvate carboxylase kinase 1-like [Pistacia vera]XP_031250718.1 phosphoenolpyruvate carboxylase kinase 1-like [Pistacia vera]
MTEALNRDYQVCEEIGRGRFGTVFRCTSRISGESFAVKSIDKSLISGDTLDSQCLLSEPKILQFLAPDHHIVQIFAVYEDDYHLHMVLELCDSQDLYHHLMNKGILSESESKSIITQLLQAISHMHKLGIVHRDIKPDNILFSSGNVVKISDFGSAEFFNNESEELMRGVVGTPYYVAPEVVAGRDYNEKVDIWSAGVVLYIMLAGFPPFYGDTVTETFEAVLRGNLRFPTQVFQSVSPMAKDLLRKMLCKEVSRRFSAEQVLRHPWIISGGANDLT